MIRQTSGRYLILKQLKQATLLEHWVVEKL